MTAWLWGLSSAGRASALQAEGHRFEPCRPHIFYGEVAQLARARGSYPRCRGFESPSRYETKRLGPMVLTFLFYIDQGIRTRRHRRWRGQARRSPMCWICCRAGFGSFWALRPVPGIENSTFSNFRCRPEPAFSSPTAIFLSMARPDVIIRLQLGDSSSE